MFLSMAAGAFVPGWIQKATNRSAGLDAPSAKPAPEVGLTGCLAAGTNGTFILRDARQTPDDPTEKSGDYLVTPIAPLVLQLDAHVSHSVRLFGVIKQNDAVPSNDNTEPTLPSLNAKELRMASETCETVADDESEDSEYSDDDSSRSGGRIRMADLGSAGMSGGGFPQLSGNYAGQSSLTSDLAPSLFAGISGGYRIGLVSGVSGSTSTQSINAVDTSTTEVVIDPSDPTQTSGWVDPSVTSVNLLASFNSIPAGSAGPAIAVNAAAVDLGVDLSVADSLSASSGPAPIPNPEPASLILLGTGLLAAANAARRRHARRSQIVG
jgi:hypothetical protein